MNLKAIANRFKGLYDSIVSTSPIRYEWWSAIEDYDFGDTTEWRYERNFLYPTIYMLVNPIQEVPGMVIPFRFTTISHIGSTKTEYLDNPLLEASSEDEVMSVVLPGSTRATKVTKLKNIVYRLKRFDRLDIVGSDEKLYVVDIHSSTAGTHVLVALLHSDFIDSIRG